MCRSFVLFACLGILLSTLYSKTAAKYRLRERRSGDKNFNLSCLLFGHIGCDVDCRIRFQMYDYDSRGKCIEINGHRNICHCMNPGAPLHPYRRWKQKFDSADIYNRIMMDYRKSHEVLKFLSIPDITGEDLKTLLRPLLSPYQYSKLKVNDNSPAAKYIKNGEVDRQSVQKFVSDQLDELLKDRWSRARSLLHMNYRYSFKNALTNVQDRGTLYNFVYKATGLGNEALKNDLEEYLEKEDIEKPALVEDEEHLISNVLHFTIVNEIIKRNDAQKKN